VRIAMRTGQDSDCNPSNAGSIMGEFLGFHRLHRFTRGLNLDLRFPHTGYTPRKAIRTSIAVAAAITRANGGQASSDGWVIPASHAASLPVERWPLAADSAPRIKHLSFTRSGDAVHFSAHAVDGNGIRDYGWSFGDLSDGTGHGPTPVYAQPGSYTVLLWASDRLGRTSVRRVSVAIP
jgi:hypothetical protein